MHFKYYQLIPIVMALIFECMCIPQIYDDAVHFCQYTLGKETLQVPRKTWTVTRNKQTLHFSICESPRTDSLCRGLHTSSCLINKIDNKIINTGSFISGSDETDRLHSQNGDTCPFNGGVSYKVIIDLECKSNTRINPSLKTVNDPCTFELTMMKPGCDLGCTSFVREGYFLDLRGFPKNLEVAHHDQDQKFKLTLCGTSNQCGFDPAISSCEILKNGSTVPLARVDSQHLHFDVVRNILTMSSKYKVDGVSRQVEVLVKCNWETEYSNVIYKKPPKIGKKYKFELESSYGCVKLPPDCHATGLNNLHYDLSDLYRPGTGFWNVSMPNGRVMLNICGPLKLKGRNPCSDEYSQVCEVQSNLYINRGSVLAHLEVGDDSVHGNFVYGSRCNSTTLHTTKIEFKCFKLEEGPVFEKFEDCITYMVWKTPKACPVNYYKGDNCKVSARLGNKDLQSLRGDHELMLHQNAKLIYNLCGPISQPCVTFRNVSFCLKTRQGRDAVIGWQNTRLISDEGILKLNFKGNPCNTRNGHGQVDVVFVCNFEDPPPTPQVEVLSDNCRFNLKVYTHLACTTDKIVTDCTFSFGNATYDLSPLVLRHRNYVVRERNSSNVISLNLCGTVVSNTGALCYGDSMICMSKAEEINFNKKFLSLGSVANPYLDESGNLVIKAKSGSHCEGLSTYYESVIYFECSTSEERPKLLSIKQCVYYFLWKTKHACRRKNNCLIPRGKRDNLIPDLNLLKAKSVNVNNITYTFHLCNESYTKCYRKNECEYMFFKQKELYENQTVVLTLSEHESCDKDSIAKVVYRFICDLEIEETISQSIANCTLFENVRSHLFCEKSEIPRNPEYNYDKNSLIRDESDIIIPSAKERFPIEQTATSESTSNKDIYYAFEETRTSKPVHHDCSFKHGEKVVNLTALGSAQEKVGDSIYCVNFNRSSDCRGVVCRNREIIVPFQSRCPKVTRDSAANTEEILFDTKIACEQDFYKTKILFGCGGTPIIIQDENCVLAIQLHLGEICNSNESLKYILIGVGLVFGAFLTGFFYFKKKQMRRSIAERHEILLPELEDKIK